MSAEVIPFQKPEDQEAAPYLITTPAFVKRRLVALAAKLLNARVDPSIIDKVLVSNSSRPIDPAVLRAEAVEALRVRSFDPDEYLAPVRLIRFRGHLPKGGYDVRMANTTRRRAAPAVWATTSKPRRSGWCWTRARPWPRSRAISI